MIFFAKYFLRKHNGEREDEKLGKSCFQKDAKVVQVSDRRCTFLPCRQVPYNFFNNSLIRKSQRVVVISSLRHQTIVR